MASHHPRNPLHGMADSAGFLSFEWMVDRQTQKNRRGKRSFLPGAGQAMARPCNFTTDTQCIAAEARERGGGPLKMLEFVD